MDAGRWLLRFLILKVVLDTFIVICHPVHVQDVQCTLGNTSEFSHSGSLSQWLLGNFSSDEIHKPGPGRMSTKIKEEEV